MKRAADRYRKLRRGVYLVLEGGPAHGPFGTIVEVFLIVLIIANVVAFTLASVPSIRQPYWVDLEVFEIFSVAVFTIEYILRLWVAIEDPRAGALERPPFGRAKADTADRFPRRGAGLLHGVPAVP